MRDAVVGLALWLVLALGTEAAETAPNLRLAWKYRDPALRLSDGISQGQTNTGAKLAVVMNDPDAGGRVKARVALLSGTGKLIASFAPTQGTDFRGFPLLANLDGVAGAEVVVGEAVSNGLLHARRGDGTKYWSVGPFGSPGMYNMGPSQGNVNIGNPGTELVVPTFDGEIVVMNQGTGAILNSYDLWAERNEYPTGHVAIAEVNAGHGGQEIVVFGGDGGRVIVLGPNPDGTMTLLYESEVFPNGGYAEGSGPAVADIDGDGSLEIIVVGTGTAAVRAYSLSHGPSCKYQWTAPGGDDYYFTSPVVGDVLPAVAGREVVVQSANSVVSVLSVDGIPPPNGTCEEGTVEWQTVIADGGDASFVPALANLTGDSGLDIVAANYTNLEILDAAGPKRRLPGH